MFDRQLHLDFFASYDSPIAIQAHHGLVDGFHISEFITTLASALDVAAEEICDA